uniref:Uncharacterized protein n=1 Tax=Myotis myotis TaxID=51298 RepID=A0A7J7XZY5_MYOMY|nr:hypothetical protein mMyoMyo1_011434 [Myotis myotis]
MAFVCITRERLSIGTLVAVSSALSSESCNPVCPHRTLVHSHPTFFCWSVGWVSANEILCTGPLIGHLGLQQTPISPWHTKSLLIFTARCYVGFFSWLCCSGLGPWQGVEIPYPSVFSPTACGYRASPFSHLGSSYQSGWDCF